MKNKKLYPVAILLAVALMSSCSSHRNQIGCPYGMEEHKTEKAASHNNYLKVYKKGASQKVG